MTFVYPLLLGGLIFAGLPVLLHFLIRQKPKTLLFPAFRFLVQKQRTNTRKLRLRHLLLLLLRIGLLVLLCLALARPRLFQEQFGLSRERPVALLLVFDTSPSMDYKVGELSRLDLAKKRSLELLDQLPDDCRILVLDSARESRKPEWAKSVQQARQQINGLSIQPNSVPVTFAVQTALHEIKSWSEDLDDPANLSYPRFLCIFSDRTLASWDGSQAVQVQKMLQQESPVKMQTLFFDVGVDEPVDSAILSAAFSEQSFAQGEILPLRVVVRLTGGGKGMVHCKVNEHTLTQSFEAEAGKDHPLTLPMDSAVWKLAPGFYQAEAKFDLDKDALPFNNQHFVTFQIRARQLVLVVTDHLKTTQKFIWALEALNYAVETRITKDTANIEPGKYAAVFLVSAAAPPEKLWDALADYVQKGGGVGIIPPGQELQAASYASDSARKIMPASIGDRVSPPEFGGQWDDAESDHPFLRPYQRWIKHPNCDFVVWPRRAFSYWAVKPIDPDSVIMHYDDDSPAVVERLWPKSGGKVVLLTTPMDQREPRWNDYAEMKTTFYVALTKMCIQYLRKATASQVLNYRYGQGIALAKPDEPFAKYLLSGPGFAEEIVFDKDTWQGDRLPRPGNYELAGANAEKQPLKSLAAFSLNIPAEESDLRRVPIADIEGILGGSSVIAQDRNTSLLDSIPQYWSEPLELFPVLMVLLLFFLAVENLLANRFYRQDTATGGA